MNLLKNPGFNEGHHHQDNVAELVVPDDWRLHFLDGETFPNGSDLPALRPESVVWNIKDAPEHEKELFFLDGSFCLKVFKAHAPLYFALTQVVSGLTPNTRYRFTAQVYPDIVKGHQGGHKVRPGDIWHAEARAGSSDPDTPWPRGHDGAVNWSAWFNINNGNFAFGEYCDIWQEFVAPTSGEVRVWVECKAKWADAENNWFMDAFSLEPVESSVGPIEPPPGGGTEPKPEPGRGAPRVQYARTYLLLPTDVDPGMAQAAMRVALATGVTVGFSPDDGGIGDLDQRRVVCVNPDQIGTGLRAWYDDFYPGVAFVPVGAANAAELETKLNQLLKPTT
jgi:hypothetical protein